MKRLFLVIIIISTSMSFSQDIERIEPPHWWAGMKHNPLELMVYAKAIADFTPSITHKNVFLKDIKRTENKNYLFLTIDISKAKPETFQIYFSKKGTRDSFSVPYELKIRRKNAELQKGFDSSDVIYLITPDRFANSDQSNDRIEGLKEQSIDRKNDYARHGGDIKGITEHLNYIADMGFTAIWSSPLLINDMSQWSYHGYAITDFYKVDPRFGTLATYKELAEKARKKGIKLIMDQIANHCGVEHWWLKDLPSQDWLNYQKGYEKGEKTRHSNHRRTTNQDLYASQKDKEGMADGWFTESMPDLNQRNPLLARYLIQNSIWWIETLGLGGIRQDTYPYPDKEFMSEWAGAIMKEYPNFSIVGEEWSYNPLLVGYWQRNARNRDGYQSNLTSAMDFPMQKAIVEALNEEESWDKGLIKMYEGLANDFYYPDPSNMMLFADNHDMDRIFTQLKEDPILTKMALSYILVLPRIPQIYYGTEILMQNTERPGDHGLIRTDFPGGWTSDTKNGFTGKGLTQEQLEMQTFLKKILNYRKNSEAIQHGKTIHFAPENGVYALFRIKDNEVVILILNKNEKATIDLKRFEEIRLKGKGVKNIITEEDFVWEEKLPINSKGAILLTTKWE